MTKPLQTGLLLATGLAGYLSARPSAPARMGRTARRPIPTGRVNPRGALVRVPWP